MQMSKGMCKFIRVTVLKSIIQGKLYKNGLNVYLRCSKIPIAWKKHYLKWCAMKVINIFNIVVKDSFMISIVVMVAFEELCDFLLYK